MIGLDRYAIVARYFPAMIVLLPVGLSVVAWLPPDLLTWGAVIEAATYTLHRHTEKEVWPPPPFREGLTTTTERLADVASPPRIFYRVAGASCWGTEGP